jgi:hypothetical protein
MIGTELSVIVIAVLATIGFVIAFRYGFTTDFGEKRERPPSEADGPGWDSWSTPTTWCRSQLRLGGEADEPGVWAAGGTLPATR